MEHRLIDANALLNSIFRITGSWELGNGRKQDFESIPVKEIEIAPTVDPIHAMGACYCGECEHYEKSTMKCFKPIDDEHTFHDYAAPIWKPTDFCSYGEPKENSLTTQTNKEIGKDKI